MVRKNSGNKGTEMLRKTITDYTSSPINKPHNQRYESRSWSVPAFNEAFWCVKNRGPPVHSSPLINSMTKTGISHGDAFDRKLSLLRFFVFLLRTAFTRLIYCLLLYIQRFESLNWPNTQYSGTKEKNTMTEERIVPRINLIFRSPFLKDIQRESAK